MRNRRHILNGHHIQAVRIQRAQRSLAALTDAAGKLLESYVYDLYGSREVHHSAALEQVRATGATELRLRFNEPVSDSALDPAKLKLLHHVDQKVDEVLPRALSADRHELKLKMQDPPELEEHLRVKLTEDLVTDLGIPRPDEATQEDTRPAAAAPAGAAATIAPPALPPVPEWEEPSE